MTIDREIWAQCRENYIRGRGSLATVAKRHNLRKGSVEKCAKRENWKDLRRDYEAAQLAKLIPPPTPILPHAPIAPNEGVSSAWLAQRQSLYYHANTDLLDKARRLLDRKLTNGTELAADELARLTTALGGIIAAESTLIGLRDRRKAKRGRSFEPYHPPRPLDVEPNDISTTDPVEKDSTHEPRL